MQRERRNKKLWAVMLTLVMGLTMMLSSVTAFASTTDAADSLVSSIYMDTDTPASYSFNTVTPEEGSGYPEDTKYYFDAILPTTSNLDSVNVEVELNSAGTITFNGITKDNTDYEMFTGVDLNQGKTLTVTVGNVTREYRVCAVITGNVNVKFAVRTDQAEAYGTANNDASIKLAAQNIRVPQNDATGYLEFSMPAGSTVMDALEFVTQDTDNAFGAYYAAINPIGAANNYISRMEVTKDSILYPLGEFTCGSMSGWMYWANGELPMVGAGNYVLNDNAIIDWKYIVDYSTIWG